MTSKASEKLNYYEARNWFWVRTAFWTVPAALVSVMAHFVFTDGLFGQISQRTLASVLGGVGSVLIGVLTAYVSQQLTWMRFGWRISFVANGPVCGIIGCVIAVMVCGILLTFIKGTPPNPVERAAAYEAYLVAVDRAYQTMVFATVAAAFWSFLFGSWFAMRRDKYFVEPILG